MWSVGYIAQLDAVFGPRRPDLTASVTLPFDALVAGLGQLVGGAVLGKVLLVLALALPGTAAMVLLRRLPWYLQTAGGLLGVLNPWVYDRVVDGQLGIVIGAALVFLWVAGWDWLLEMPTVRRGVVVGASVAAPIAVDPHSAGLMAVLLIFAGAWKRPWRDPAVRGGLVAAVGVSLGILAIAATVFFVGNANGSYAAVSQFGRADFEAFRAYAPDGLVPRLAGLYGFWGERTGTFPRADGGSPLWLLAPAVLTILAVLGAVSLPRRAWLLGAGIVGLGISASTATSLGLDAAVALNQHLPVVAAYREPQKWSALWLLALVVLPAALGALLGDPEAEPGPLGALARRVPRDARPALGGVVAGAIVLATLVPAGLFQLRELTAATRPITYPVDWYRASAYLAGNVRSDDLVVVLPWHEYVSLPFVGHPVANPARVFFPGHLLLPTDPELPGATQRFDSPHGIGAIALAADDGTCALADTVRSLGARTVIVEQAADAGDMLARLTRCGFGIAIGAPGQVVVLQT